MKLRYLLVLITAFAFSLTMINCGDKKSDESENQGTEQVENGSTDNSDKRDMVIEFVNSFVEEFDSEEGRAMFKNRTNDFQQKANEIARDAGFNNLMDAVNTLSEFVVKNDQEIIDLQTKMNSLAQ